jgi:tetratricopeptide (TPR) repeat protein
MVSPAPVIHERQIRVFVSSTFRDMQADRDILVKKVFPQLRKRCEQRLVNWVEVDLRWGITDEQVAEGHVLPLCLAEIARCRPFFLCLLGERYGWVPDSFGQVLEQEENWLRDHDGHSITELEITHGVLNAPKMADHAYFYFRDASYVDPASGPSRGDFGPESAESADKLSRLKNGIRQAYASGLLSNAPREGYASPDALAELVLEDFTQLIDRLYPALEVPNAADRQRGDHEANARRLVRGNVPRRRVSERLDAYADGESSAPLVVLGESGIGKSTVLADWVCGRQASYADELVVVHFVGGPPGSSDSQGILRRFMHEFKNVLGLLDDVPTDPVELRETFPIWMARMAARGRMVLVVDGLNHLTHKDGAPDLGWLPEHWPANVRPVISTGPGRAMNAIASRGWISPDRSITVGPFGIDERRLAISTFLSMYRKTLQTDMAERLASAPQSGSPLFLRTVLDELRQCGDHDRLTQFLDTYLDAPDMTTLYQKILVRWEQDFEDESDLVGDSLALIWASRRGLSESELLDLLGSAGGPFPRRFWTPFRLAVEGSLADRGGLLDFANDFLRSAVEALYVPTEAGKWRYRQRLADYFWAQDGVPERKLDETPWQQCESENWPQLKKTVTTFPVFLQLREESRFEDLRRYWLRLGAHCRPTDAYAEALDELESSVGGESETYARALGAVASFHSELGDYDAAEPLFVEAIEKLGRAIGETHPDVLTTIDLMGILQHRIGDEASAEEYVRRARAGRERVLGPRHPDTLQSSINLAAVLARKGSYRKARALVQQTLDAYTDTLGPDHPFCFACLCNLGVLYGKTSDYATAESLQRRALAGLQRVLGPEHPDTLQILGSLGITLGKSGDEHRQAEAEMLLRQSLLGSERLYGRDHPGTLLAMGSLGALLFERDRIREAEPLLRAEFEGFFRLSQMTGRAHPRLRTAEANYGAVLQALGCEPYVARAIVASINDRDGVIPSEVLDILLDVGSNDAAPEGKARTVFELPVNMSGELEAEQIDVVRTAVSRAASHTVVSTAGDAGQVDSPGSRNGVLSGSATVAQPRAGQDGEARRTRPYQADLAAWRALPWWKRVRQREPKPPPPVVS